MTLLDDRPLTAALAGVLDGQRGFGALIRRLGGPDREWFLICLPARATGRVNDVCPDAVVAPHRGHVFVLAPYTTAQRAATLADRCGVALAPGARPACWSEPVTDETDPVGLSRALLRGVSLLTGATRTASLAQLRPQLVLAELAELGAGLPVGPAEKLLAHDRDRRTQLVATLAAYFDAGGDMTEAAKHLFLHRNTLRYRLTQAERVCGMSLRSPLERFVLELEIRVLRRSTHADPPALGGTPTARMAARSDSFSRRGGLSVELSTG